MNKNKLIDYLIKITQQNLEAAYDAAKNTYDIATHEENKAENKYDTRGLEASYLAGAQAKRVADIKLTLASYQNLQIKNFTDECRITLSALVEVAHSDINTYILLMPKGGGQILNFENKTIQVVTPESPLGKNLISKYVGDVFQITLQNKISEYEIVKVW